MPSTACATSARPTDRPRGTFAPIAVRYEDFLRRTAEAGRRAADKVAGRLTNWTITNEPVGVTAAAQVRRTGMSAKPADWPRAAPVALTLISLAAAGAAVGLVVAAADRSSLAGVIAGVLALAGALAMFLLLAVARRLDRDDRWTSGLRVASALAILVLLIPIGVTARVATGTVRLVAFAPLAGAAFGAFVGSLLWRRAVIRADRRRAAVK